MEFSVSECAAWAPGRTELVADALKMALYKRMALYKPMCPNNVIVHSDRESESATPAFIKASLH